MAEPRETPPAGLAVETVPPTSGSGQGAPREPLLARHREARRRRDAAPLNSPAYREASIDIARLEVEIARLEQPGPPAAPK